MARPSKSAAVIAAEGRSHRTAAEMEHRERAERGVLSNRPMEPRDRTLMCETALAEFRRIEGLYDAIGRNDAMYEGAVNMYCATYAELLRLEERRDRATDEAERFGRDKAELLAGGMYEAEHAALKIKLEELALKLDKAVMQKRAALFGFEKEGGMTLASAMRIIPKQPEPETNPLMEVLTILNCV